jgi:RNA polymerase sigma-70 factor (ECF subfamily)
VSGAARGFGSDIVTASAPRDRGPPPRVALVATAPPNEAAADATRMPAGGPARHRAARDTSHDAQLERLLVACAAGDRPAFEALYRLTSPRLFAVAVRMLERRALAEEVLQDCYLSIWNNARSYRRDLAAPMTWMIAVVRNRCLDGLRRAKPVELAPRRDDEDDPFDALPSDEPTPLEHLCAAADAGAIGRCVAKLAPEHRQAIVLTFFEGLSREELAERLERPVGTVKTWVRRALARLKNCLEAS